MANEKFVSQNQNDEVIKETFTLFGYSILSVVVVIALLWDIILVKICTYL